MQEAAGLRAWAVFDQLYARTRSRDGDGLGRWSPSDGNRAFCMEVSRPRDDGAGASGVGGAGPLRWEARRGADLRGHGHQAGLPCRRPLSWALLPGPIVRRPLSVANSVPTCLSFFADGSSRGMRGRPRPALVASRAPRARFSAGFRKHLAKTKVVKYGTLDGARLARILSAGLRMERRAQLPAPTPALLRSEAAAISSTMVAPMYASPGLLLWRPVCDARPRHDLPSSSSRVDARAHQVAP